MKILKRISLTILILVIVGFVFRGWIYRNCITYKSIDQRQTYIATNNKLIDYLETYPQLNKDSNIDDIIKAGLLITSEKLSYKASKNQNDPNKLIISKNAHCIGYASFFSTTCNYLLAKYHLDTNWIANPKVGQLYFLGINIHEYIESPFFKDHDFVIIKNRKTGEILAVDPTINDYLDINFVTYKE